MARGDLAPRNMSFAEMNCTALRQDEAIDMPYLTGNNLQHTAL